MLFFMPLIARHILPGEVVRPLTRRQVVFYLARFSKDGSHQEGVTQHILTVQVMGIAVFRKLQYHAPHGGNALLLAVLEME